MLTLDNGDPNDIRNVLAKHIGVEPHPDGSYFVKARLLVPFDEAHEENLQEIVVERLGLGRWLDGPTGYHRGPEDWTWGGYYLPENVAVPDDASTLDSPPRELPPPRPFPL
jgi:hypothetical protein